MENIDLKRLDELAKTNGMAKDRQLGEIENSIRRCGSFFSFASEAKVIAYAHKLQSLGFGAVQINAACDKVVTSQDKFPSLKAIIDIAGTFGSAKSYVPCNNCCDGIMSVYLKTTGINYAFACDCDAGKQYHAFQKWASVNQNKFTRLAPSVISKDGSKDPYPHLKS